MARMINLLQTKNERRLKYHYARLAGCSYSEAKRIADFGFGHMIQYLHTHRDLLDNYRRTAAYKRWRERVYGKKDIKFNIGGEGDSA